MLLSTLSHRRDRTDLLQLEPWREAVHRQVMCFLAESGQRGAALVQYEVCCRELRVEFGAPPSAETVSLYLRIRDGGAEGPEHHPGH
ncbi:MAG: bacterial transcriptional activator domain-containing protein [Anaerolineae bacterium]|nr:bacterial transcriptional activator domain-containing protein [Anaerolineae bacterium]